MLTQISAPLIGCRGRLRLSRPRKPFQAAASRAAWLSWVV
jgi:hypothetical protein